MGALVTKLTFARSRATETLGPAPIIAALAARRIAMFLAIGAATDLAGRPWAVAVAAALAAAGKALVA